MTKRGLKRFPAVVYRVGEEPDPRFSLANERTFLAWMRTGLALTAGGVALDAVRLSMPDPLHQAVVLILLALGLLVPAFAWINWARTERALRLARPLPGSRLVLPLAVGVLALAALILIGVLQ